MYKLTKQELANKAADSWKNQYCPTGVWNQGINVAVFQELKALGDTPTPEQVDSVIGNRSWTMLKCYECDTEVNAVIILGNAEYEKETYICKGCLNKAVKLFKDRLLGEQKWTLKTIGKVVMFIAGVTTQKNHRDVKITTTCIGAALVLVLFVMVF